MPEDLPSPTPTPTQPALEYEQRASFVSRKQYRRLMALTLLNTILLAGFAVGPAVGPMVRSQWNQFQAKRAERLAQQQRTAAIAAAKAYTAPAGLIVYEERPDEAAKLLAAEPSRYRVISEARVAYFPARPWQSPVELKEMPLSLRKGGGRASAAPAFVGARKTPRGTARLVVVSVRAQQRSGGQGYENERVSQQVQTTRSLYVQVLSDDGGNVASTVLNIGRPADSRARVLWPQGATSGDKGPVDFETRGLMCIYAGQSDLADESHFTIDYDMDGRRGTINGWLRDDDRVELKPRQGAIVDRDSQGRETVWDLGRSPPATHPTPTTLAADHENRARLAY